MRRGLTWHLGLGRELGFVFWAMICVEAAFGSYMAIWPLWVQALGAPIAVVGLVLGSQGLLRPLTLLPSAALAERFEARTLISLARAITGIGMITAAFATHWTQLFIFVVATAIGELAFPLTQSHLAAHAGEQRVRAFTLVFNVGPAAALGLSPLLSGLLVAIWGMQAAFLIGAFWTLLSIVFFVRLSAGRDKTPGARPVRSTYREAFAQSGVRPLISLQFTTIFVLALGISLIPTFLAQERAMDPAAITMLGSIGAIGTVSFGLVVSRTTALQRAPFVAIAIAVGFVVASMSVIVGTHLIWLILIAFLGRGGLFSAWGLFIAAASEVVSERHRPRLFALCEMAGGMAFSFAPILAGVLYSIGPETPLLASIALGSVLIPVLVYSQRRLSAPRVADPGNDPTEIEVLSPVDESPPLVAPDGPECVPAERELAPARPVAVPER
jgi:MFS family permease